MSKRNKSIDAGLAYMKELGFRAAGSINIAHDELRTVADESIVNNLINVLYDRHNELGKYTQSDLYIAKNATLDLSLCLSSTYRTDMYRKVCNWIVNHKELFGSVILDLGCDCGIMTCFLARQFPESHIIGIDIIPEAIENAKQLAIRLNVSNVEFICIDAFLFDKSVDTVFSMLVIRELCDDNDINCRYKTFNDIAKYWSSAYDKIVSHISEILSVGGYMITIHNDYVNLPGFLAFLYSLYYHNLCFRTCDFIFAKELNFDYELECIVAMHDNKINIKNVTDTLIFNKYVNDILCHVCDLNKLEYSDFEAKLMRDVRCGELIRGFHGIEKSGEYVELSVWRDKFNTYLFIFFRTEGVEKFTCIKSDDLVKIYRLIDSIYKLKSTETDCIIDWEKMD